MAVDDALQGKGLGTLLLERLALIAVRHGFQRFWALTMAENRPMLDVFRASGFESSSRFDSGYVEIDLSVVPSESSVARRTARSSRDQRFAPSVLSTVVRSRGGGIAQSGQYRHANTKSDSRRGL